MPLPVLSGKIGGHELRSDRSADSTVVAVGILCRSYAHDADGSRRGGGFVDRGRETGTR
jgi:hypothetical protein